MIVGRIWLLPQNWDRTLRTGPIGVARSPRSKIKGRPFPAAKGLTEMNIRWNISRRREQGLKFLRLAQAADIDAARALWKDPATPVHQRCLAARAIGLLGKHGPSWRAPDVEDYDSPLGRAFRHANDDAQRRREADNRASDAEQARVKMVELDAGSVSQVIAILQDATASPERRENAAFVLRGLRCRDAVSPLIEALSEGHPRVACMCMSALNRISSRQGARRLINIARGRSFPLPARQEAIYTLWSVNERRAEPLFIQLSSAADSEEEYTRDMATEALGNTCWRRRTQKALSERLFDPSASVRFAALCAVARLYGLMLPCLHQALVAKLDDPGKVDDNRVIATMAAEMFGRCR